MLRRSIVTAIMLGLCGCATPPPPPAARPAPPAFSPPTALPSSEAWRKSPPPSGPESRFEAEWTVTELANGMPLVVVEAPRFPIAMVAVLTRGGASADPRSKPGLTYMTYQLLGRRTQDYSPLRLLRATRALGATLDVAMNREAGVISMRTFSQNVPQALALLAEVALRSEIDAAAVTRRIEAMGKVDDNLEASANAALAAQLRAALYGARHPHRYPIWGDPKALRKTDDGAVFLHRAGVLRPERSALVVVGKVDVAEVQRAAHVLFGTWQEREKRLRVKLRRVPAPPDRTPGVTLVHRPALSQTSMCLARTFAPPSPSVQRALRGLSARLQERLFAVIREARGFAYGVSVSYDPSPGAQSLKVCTKVAKSVTLEAISELMEGMIDFAQPPEGAQAKLQLSAARPRPIADIGGLVSEVLDAFVDGRLSAVEGRTRRVEAPIAAEDIEAARAYLDPGQYHLVLVGDAWRLRPKLAKMGLGEVKIVP